MALWGAKLLVHPNTVLLPQTSLEPWVGSPCQELRLQLPVPPPFCGLATKAPWPLTLFLPTHLTAPQLCLLRAQHLHFSFFTKHQGLHPALQSGEAFSGLQDSAGKSPPHIFPRLLLGQSWDQDKRRNRYLALGFHSVSEG